MICPVAKESRTQEKNYMRGKNQLSKPGFSFFGPAAVIMSAFIALQISIPEIQAAAFVVSSTGDSGAGTLRQAILDANASGGLDTISFSILGAGVHTITPLTPLPAVTDPVIIDGTTQPGFAGQPLIEINGTSAGANAGLRLTAGNSTVRGLVINRFQTDGIDISGGGTNIVACNYIGTDSSGLVARGNAFEGVLITSSSANVIGGTNVADRNLLSGNSDAGVYILNSSGNFVLGNYIGTSVAGTAQLGNTNNGVAIYNSTANQVGGTNTAARNIISGNGGSGVYLFGSGSYNNVVQGNYIGTSKNGTSGIANTGDGVTLSAALINVIGGAVAGSGNLISGNDQAGVSLGASASGNLVQGNLIGTDLNGSGAIPNSLAGVTIYGAGGNLVGGVVSGTGNVISGNNQDGIFILTNNVGNTVAGNFIGLNAAGTGSLPNLFNGLSLSNAVANTIGGTSGSARNVISGNANYGLEILSGSASNVVEANFIGTDPAGATAEPNTLSGIRIEGRANTIGIASHGNLISGNGQDGIFITGATASNNVVQGNYIGTSGSGTSSLSNGRAGVGISGASINVIGNAGAGNLISANNDAGIYLIGTGATGNQIRANSIGTDVSGNFALGNIYEGIYVERAASNVIGAINAGNLVSGNFTRGIFLTNAAWNIIQANMIGTKVDGVSTLANVYHGVECENRAANNTIGGTAAGAGNRIAFASVGYTGLYAGVRIRSGATNDAVLGNSIFSNGALGIDLGNFGVNPNIACEIGVGGTANMSQNYPLLTQAVIGGISGGVGVRGTLNSAPGKTFRLQFFATSVCDSSGNGEGQIYLGDKTVTTPGSCSTNFVATFPASIPQGYVITSTATDPTNNTSEFSPCLVGSPVPSLTISNDDQHTVSLIWTNTTTGFVLLQTDNLLPPAQWALVTNVPANSGGNFIVTLPILTTSNRFFALSFQ
jgi:hypothetical protein